MKQPTLQLLLLLLWVPLLAQVTQERTVVASGGDQMTSGSLSLSWTLGETMTETTTAAGIIVSQGFQQEGLNPTGTHDTRLPFEVAVFPNPTSNAVHVTAETTQPIAAELVATDGRVLQQRILDFAEGKATISLANLPAATYYLMLKAENNSFTTFKIQKL